MVQIQIELQKNLIDYQRRYNLYQKKRNSDENEKEKTKEKEKAFKPSSEIECYNCGEKGHIKRNCKKKKKTESNEQAKKAEETEEKKSDTKHEHAWMAKVEEHVETKKWILDSGASQHMTNMKNWFESYTILKNPIIIETASTTITAIGRGNIRMKTFIDGEVKEGVMYNVLHVPQIRDNLLSIASLQKRKFDIHFNHDQNYATISKDGVIYGRAERSSLYEVEMEIIQPE